MLFLIEYNRKEGRIVSFHSFDETKRHEADEARLALELKLLESDEEHEVVLLDAANEDAIRKTHRRYFEDIESIIRSFV